MPVVIELSKNAILLNIQNKALETRETYASSRSQTPASRVRTVAEVGRHATLPSHHADFKNWFRKITTAQTIEGVIGPRLAS